MNQVVTITLKAILPEGTDLPKRLNYVLADALSEYMYRRIGIGHGTPSRTDAEAYVSRRYATMSDEWRKEKSFMVLAATTWASALRDAALQMEPAKLEGVGECMDSEGDSYDPNDPNSPRSVGPKW